MNTKYNSVKTTSFKVNNIKEDLAMLMLIVVLLWLKLVSSVWFAVKVQISLVVNGLNENIISALPASRVSMRFRSQWMAENNLKKVLTTSEISCTL